LGSLSVSREFAEEKSLLGSQVRAWKPGCQVTWRIVMAELLQNAQKGRDVRRFSFK
jgi:hypothetical protein